jgi:hypothetical protein
MWGHLLAPSSKPHENDLWWIVRNIIGVVHAIFVSVIALPAVISLSGAPDDVRFAAAPHLETCTMGAGFHHGEPWASYIEAVALAGLAFTAFTTADVALSMIHGLATIDYMVHHAAFILAGFILRGNCILPWKGSVQLAMEASTPFLNIMLLLQNRGVGTWPVVVVCGIIFVVSYVFLRLIQNTYATVILWLRRDEAFPPTMPRWEVWLALLACTAGAAVQFFWFPAIVRKLLKLMPGNADKDENQPSGSRQIMMGNEPHLATHNQVMVPMQGRFIALHS